MSKFRSVHLQENQRRVEELRLQVSLCPHTSGSFFSTAAGAAVQLYRVRTQSDGRPV
jgi:hypothetical protein